VTLTLTNNDNNNRTEINEVERLIAGEFLKSPTAETVQNCIKSFIAATNTSAVTSVLCVSCAREVFATLATTLKVMAIPNQHLLKPHTPHVKQDILNRMVVYKPAINGDVATICNECLQALQDSKMPKLSLANDMWIGDVPIELSCLTLPERVLITRYFPAAYIVKLYPKQKGASSWDNSQLFHRLKGNVSTYRLDLRQVALIVSGNNNDSMTMPHPSKILSATIGITFIGPKGFSKKTMPAMFRVRRFRVRNALLWLKNHNPLYSDINICEECLAQLPEDGIPEEFIHTAHYSSDIESVHQEHEGYMPVESEDGV